MFTCAQPAHTHPASTPSSCTALAVVTSQQGCVCLLSTCKQSLLGRTLCCKSSLTVPSVEIGLVFSACVLPTMAKALPPWRCHLSQAAATLQEWRSLHVHQLMPTRQLLHGRAMLTLTSLSVSCPLVLLAILRPDCMRVRCDLCSSFDLARGGSAVCRPPSAS